MFSEIFFASNRQSLLQAYTLDKSINTHNIGARFFQSYVRVSRRINMFRRHKMSKSIKDLDTFATRCRKHNHATLHLNTEGTLH